MSHGLSRILEIVLQSEQSTGINPSSTSVLNGVCFGVYGRPIRNARPSSSESNHGGPSLVQWHNAHLQPNPLNTEGPQSERTEAFQNPRPLSTAIGSAGRTPQHLRRRTREYYCLSLRLSWEGCVSFVLKLGGGLAKVSLQWLTLQIPIGCGRRP